MWRFTAKQKVESSPYQPVRRNKWRWIRRKNKWIQLSKLFGNRTKWRNNCFRKTHTYTYIHYFCTFSIETMPTKLLYNITSNLISFFQAGIYRIGNIIASTELWIIFKHHLSFAMLSVHVRPQTFLSTDLKLLKSSCSIFT